MEVPMTAAVSKEPLMLNFKEETVTTVSRSSLRAVAKKLGFNETQTVLYAIARLRDEVLDEAEKDALMPLTQLHHRRIAKATPKTRGKVVETLLP
jgi:hypothetical protein